MATGVLVPVGGFAPYLAQALDAVLAERPAEVVVVDDAADPPVALHPDHAPLVRLVRRARRGGPAEARATGLTILSPEVDAVALCDADDAWEPGSLALREAALAADPGAGLVFGRAVVVGPDDRPTGERWAAPPAGPLALADLYAANPLPTSSVLLRRAALDDAGGFHAPVRVAEDWDLWLRVARTGRRIVCVPDAVVRYRRHPGGLTADVAGLARAQLDVHRRHADAVGATARDRALARDLRALARGLAREGAHAQARAALAQAAELAPAPLRERMLRGALAVPGTRALVARRDPYRGVSG
ncbi:MAG TPA: glycosyltransferase [Baekduia sp.]|nr:glycosyltransferase [Baekduia sp.]